MAAAVGNLRMRVSFSLKKAAFIAFAGAAVVFTTAFFVAPDPGALPPPAFVQSGSAGGAPAPPLYVYGNPAVSLENILVRVVYFMPKGSGGGVDDFAESAVFLKEEIFPQIAAFHSREFQGVSRVEFSLFSQPVFGVSDRNAYEKDFLDVSVSDPLRMIEQEVEGRILREGGDLYDATFARNVAGTYHILLIAYGAPIPSATFAGQEWRVPGMAGDAGTTTALVFRSMTDPQMRSLWPNAAAVIAHELLHTMGVPEQYDPRSSGLMAQRANRRDIMGSGVAEPIAATFIGDDVKRAMGLY
ncbi:MAG: hypothetical protein A2991_03400 [Candidatus Terrybacteria bacterium RIFCSPLOWO2_01_FULL_58_14]|uniref:Uncharacterized protein n=2 Tax=Candidatus Terryibacteriota TaxID=1817920 RepID=A0A1G2PVR8_9BACT|nr:MAG: hypothetical protein A2682_02300 [Candidatus Terrybacteria bacterium RIFCSPHIGHO2_01_FULL_58_15]OHA52426.1 MAG: hypothetical protein A2991_03400 [Candidatus Terrybacteria bacterium RIFCSPLOWO2_01_FULL_58_14]